MGGRCPDPGKGPDTSHLYLRAQPASKAPGKTAGPPHQTERRQVGSAGSDAWVSGHITVGSGCSRSWVQDPGLGMESQAELQSGQGGVGYRTGSRWGTAHSGQQFFILLAKKISATTYAHFKRFWGIKWESFNTCLYSHFTDEKTEAFIPYQHKTGLSFAWCDTNSWVTHGGNHEGLGRAWAVGNNWLTWMQCILQGLCWQISIQLCYPVGYLPPCSGMTEKNRLDEI